MPPIDAERAYAEGVLRQITVGAVRRAQRGEADMATEVAVPLARLSSRLMKDGRRDDVDKLLIHAVHDGVTPGYLAAAFVVVGSTSEDPTPAPPAPPTPVGPKTEQAG